MQVSAYGLHWNGAVAWLLQGRKGNNFVGLKGDPPFEVAAKYCNHLIPAAAPIPDRVHWGMWEKISSDPLVRAMLPIPHDPGQNLFYVEDPSDALRLQMTTLSRLSSPIESVLRPIWTVKLKQLETELTATNIQPLVLTQASAKDQKIVDTLAKLAPYSPRTVIVTGHREVVASSPFTRLKTEIDQFEIGDIIPLPLENIGAMILRRFARREDIDAPLETREERRNRNIKERNQK